MSYSKIEQNATPPPQLSALSIRRKVNELYGETKLIHRLLRTLLFSRPVSASVLRRFGLPPLMPVSHDGSRVLGAPIGSDDFKRTFAEDRVAEIISDLEVLHFMPSLQMQNGLANGAVIHRVNHPLLFSSGEARAGAARTISEAQNFASVLSLIAKILIVLEDIFRRLLEK